MKMGIAFAILFGAGLLQAQESVDISPSQDQSASTQGGPGTSDPEHYSARSYSMRALLCFAYVITDCQREIAGDASLLDTKRYNVEENVPLGTTREQFHILLQYKLKSRIQDEGYDLILGNGAQKLTVQSLFLSKAHVGELVSVVAIAALACLIGCVVLLWRGRAKIIPAASA